MFHLSLVSECVFSTSLADIAETTVNGLASLVDLLYLVMAAVGLSLFRLTGAMSLRSFSRSLPSYALQQPFHVSRHISDGDESSLLSSYGRLAME